MAEPLTTASASASGLLPWALTATVAAPYRLLICASVRSTGRPLWPAPAPHSARTFLSDSVARSSSNSPLSWVKAGQGLRPLGIKLGGT